MSSETTVVAVDTQFADIAARNHGLSHFPLRKYLEQQRVRSGYDFHEVLVTGVQFPPDDASAAATGEAALTFRRKREALEAAGARVLISPAKRTREGALKHSDDATLMVNALSVCFRVHARWFFLVASDGDFAPLVWALRDFGVRTELFACADALAPELRRAAHRVTFLDTWLHETGDRNSKKPEVPLQLIRTTERVTAPGAESFQTVN